MSYSEKSPPGFNRSTDEYDKWKKKFDVWQLITEVPKARQGGLLILKLDDTTQDEVLEQIQMDEIAADDGIKKVIDILDKLFKKDASITAFELYENFVTYTRPQNCSISEYCHEFHRRHQKVKAIGAVLPEPVLAYHLLKSSNISEQGMRLVKTTISKMTYDEMSAQLKKAFSSGLHSSSQINVKTEEEEFPENETLYGATARNFGRKDLPTSRGRYKHDSFDRNRKSHYLSPIMSLLPS